MLAFILIPFFHHGPKHQKHQKPTLQHRAAKFVSNAQDVVDGYIKDERSARYERAEIARVQDDIDNFNLSVPDEKLWVEIDNLVADLNAMAAKDLEIIIADEL